MDTVIRSAGPGDARPAAVFARAFAEDPDQVPVALVTGEQSNVGYYESLGFAVTGQAEPPGGGPALWTMWRKAPQ